MRVRFEWDPAKGAINQARHGVSFEEASRVFVDPEARIEGDVDHSDREDRGLIVGRSNRMRLLTAVFAYDEEADVIRISGARRATARERADSIWRRR